MLLKTFGVILLLSGSLYLCFCFTQFERRRLQQCEGLLLLLRHIKAQISCFHMPLGRIYATFSSEELERCGFLEALRQTEDISKALDSAKGEMWLSGEEMTLLRAFSGEVGASYVEEQIACCDYYIGQLEQAYAERKTALPARRKLYRSLFITGGLMLVIILL